MSDPSGTSFIPKRGPQKRTRSSSSRQVYVFTLISYTLIFAALLASLGVYVYIRVLERNELTAAASLDSAITSFSVADMEKVHEYDRRLIMVTERVDNLVSVNSVLSAIEEATAKSVQFENLVISRDEDSTLILDANLITDDFDSALFQRGIYERQGEIRSFSANELAIQREVNDSNSSSIAPLVVEESITLSGVMTFDVDDVLFDPNSSNVFVESLNGNDVDDVDEGTEENSIDNESNNQSL
jgi:hypothetical protein